MNAQTKPQTVSELMDASMYHEAAELALQQAGVTLKIKAGGHGVAPWDEKGTERLCWDCALESEHGSHTFTFWDSIHNTNARAPKRPTAYDIVSCLQWNMSGTFKQWCDELGYDTDSRRAFATYGAVRAEYLGLCRVVPNKKAREVFALIQ